MNKDIRACQRFSNLENAFIFLREGLKKKDLDPLQEAGIIQSFEFTFKLAWKTLKDYLESKGTIASFARDVIQEAYAAQIIKDGHLWIEMLDKRNMLSHTYNREKATQAVEFIRNHCFVGLEQVYLELKKRCSD